jgi:hypothetical protein
MVFGLSSPNYFGAIICHPAEVITFSKGGKDSSHKDHDGTQRIHLIEDVVTFVLFVRDIQIRTVLAR